MAEKDYNKDSELGVTRDSSNDGPAPIYTSKEANAELSFWTRMGCTPESFKRRTLSDKNNQLNQTLKKRHLHMIAIGGSIGAGLFVGSGAALNTGGPAALLICFGIIGVMVFNVCFALGELAVMYPVSGGFYTYSARFVDPSWGFAMGWNYVFQWAIVLPLELTVAGLTVEYWEVGVSVAVWITVFLVALIIINIFGVLGYGEEEFWSSALKLAAIIIFMIIALVLVLGGGKPGTPYDEYYGARLWYNPGAFSSGFKGVCATFVTAAFSFSGTELVGLAAAESVNPVKQLPGAIKQVFWRITLFYILSLMFVGLLVPYDEPRLIGGGGASASPFVIVANNARLWGFDHFMNVVILVSVISIGNSGVYGGSRTLTALAEQGYAPKIFTYVDRAGRPLWSTILILACGLLGYMNLAATGEEIFNWLLSLSGLAALFTWGSICVAHIRFRAAWAYHGHTLDEIPFKAVGGVYGSWLGVILIFLVLVAQFYTALFPVGGVSEDGRAYDFFRSYLALPVVLVFWIAGYVWKRAGFLTLAKINVEDGRREIDWDRIHAYRAERAAAPAWKKIYYFMF